MRSVRVLYVEDDPGYAELVARVLTSERENFEVVTTPDAASGMKRLAEERFDCVVSDYQMPGRDGLEFCADVREVYPELPFILFTNRGSEEVASEAISVGATDYLQKGSGRERYALLANRVENAVERGRSKQRAADQRRINEVVNRINRTLVRTTSREEIESTVCEIFSESDPYLFAWIGEPDEMGRVVPRASAGIEEGYFDSVTITADDSETGRGPAGVAIRERRVAVSQNIAADDDFSPWREAARARGYESVAAAPLEYDEEFYGILVVYADRPEAFDESERELLEEVADDVAHAMAAVETRAALRKEHDRFERLFEHTTDPIAYCEFDGDEPIITDVNPAFERVFGYGRDRAVGRALDDLVVPTNRIEEGRDISRRTRMGEYVRTEVVRETADGLGTFRHQSIPFEADGETHQYAIYTPVTERREREATLERLHRATRSLYDAEDREAVAKLTADAARDVLDYPNNVVRLVSDDGQTLRAVAVTDVAQVTLGGRPDYPVEGTAAGEAYRTGEPVVYTEADELDEGYDHGRAECVMYVPIGDHGVLSIADVRPDVFDQSDVELAGLLATNAATAIDSVEQRREIIRENRRLERFSAILSHDLRNPLDVAQGYLELVDSDDERLDRVADAHSRMYDIIEDVLTMAKQGGSVDDADLEVVSLSGVAREAWRNVATGNAELVVDDSETIAAERSKLLELFENLFRNSVEHGATRSRSPPADGGGRGATDSRDESGDDGTGSLAPCSTLTVRVGPFDEGFFVEDDGVGFDGLDGPTELDPWTIDGTGLGLNIVAELAGAHGWRVFRTNADDGGARFEIRTE